MLPFSGIFSEVNLYLVHIVVNNFYIDFCCYICAGSLLCLSLNLHTLLIHMSPIYVYILCLFMQGLCQAEKFSCANLSCVGLQHLNCVFANRDRRSVPPTNNIGGVKSVSIIILTYPSKSLAQLGDVQLANKVNPQT